MKSLTIREFRASIGQLNQLAEKVGELTITRHGKPILRILPIHPKLERPFHKDLRAKMSQLLTPSAQYIRDDRDER